MIKPTSFEVIPDDMFVDLTVQRPLDTSRIEKGDLSKYDDTAVGTVILSSREDGRYHTIDGQHRMHAARFTGNGAVPVPALVYEGLTREEEARLFLIHNATKVINALDMFRIRIASGDADAKEIERVVESHDWRIGQYHAKGVISAIRSIEFAYSLGKIYEDGRSSDTLDATLALITAAWDYHADSVRQSIIRGVALVMRRYGPDADMAKLAAEMGNVKPRNLQAFASGRGNSESESIAVVLVEMNNRKRTKHRLPAWDK